jgi:type IV pilus assembly protein PilP
MHNYSVTMRYLTILLGCVLLFLWGCEKKPDVKESKQVVSKKIVVAGKGASKASPEKEKKTPPKPAKQEPGKVAPSGVTPPVKPDVKKADEKAGKPVTPSIVITKKMDALAYVYDPTGKLDPFAPIFREQVSTRDLLPDTKKKTRRTPLTPLEQISLSQLKLVAVMLAPSGHKALVEEVSGKGYIIQEGTYVGMNAGQVVDILIDTVVVEEEVEDILGNFTIRKTEMKLQKAAGE